MTTPAAPPSSSYGREWSFRQRAAALLISILINLLILWILLTLAPRIAGRPDGKGGTLSTFNVSNDTQKASGAKAAARQQRETTKSPAKAAIPKPIVQLPVQHQDQVYTPFIELSRDDFKKSDISKIAPSPSQSVGQGNAPSEGIGAGDTQLAGGSGPNGEPLYAAEWYRRPTDAEVGPYLAKARIPEEGAYADIACQTMPRFHVDNCIPLGDSPPGSHLALAIRDAAWQFLVRPPRVGGKTLVGAWVRIHYTITITHRRGAGSDSPEP